MNAPLSINNPSTDDMFNMSRDQKEQYLKLLKEKNLRLKQNKIAQYYPEEGPLSRHNYPKHMAFFNAGNKYSERCIIAANRIGKSEGIGAYELTLHLTGRYQHNEPVCGMWRRVRPGDSTQQHCRIWIIHHPARVETW